MTKLKLQLDDLSVESFETHFAEAQGTVLGNDSDYTEGTCPGFATCDASCDASCNGTCFQTCAGGTCNGTCGFSCPQSCYGTCQGYRGDCMAEF